MSSDQDPQAPRPYVGEDPPPGSVPPPQRYEGPAPETHGQGSQDLGPSGPPPAPAQPPQAAPPPATERSGSSSGSGASDLEKRLLAISGPVGFVLFMGAGFLFDGWAWSWLFLSLPGIAYAWVHATD